MSICPTSSLKCNCKKKAQLDSEGQHLLCCPKGGGWHLRHQNVLECFKRLAKHAGVQVAKPAAVMDTISGQLKYPDLEFRPSEVFKGATVVLDFSITYPSISTTHKSTVQGAAASMRESDKQKKYHAAAAKDNKVSQ